MINSGRGGRGGGRGGEEEEEEEEQPDNLATVVTLKNNTTSILNVGAIRKDTKVACDVINYAGNVRAEKVLVFLTDNEGGEGRSLVVGGAVR